MAQGFLTRDAGEGVGAFLDKARPEVGRRLIARKKRLQKRTASRMFLFCSTGE